jgi:peptidylprolyl isomerase
MSRTFRTWSLAALIGLPGALGLASCSSGGNTGSSSATTTTSASGSATTGGGTSGGTGAATAIGTIPASDRSPAGTAGTAPKVIVPSGPPSTQLESADLIEGTGATAADGDAVTVQYVLATYSSHKVIQSSWTSQPFSFVLGEGQVIPGWDEGVVGMKVGGRRELIIPASLGYKNVAAGPGIAANDTLVFVIDLLKVS